jgi:hypothetical protein
MYGPLYYRQLEANKIKALRLQAGDYDKKTCLTDGAKAELTWWIDSVADASRPISHGEPDMVISTDASGLGFGYCDKKNNLSGGGMWSADERDRHINYLEILAAWLGLKALCAKEQNKHIRIMIDNQTAVCYIREMGGTKSPQCNEIAKQIWEWAMERNIWVSAQHLPGTENVEADHRSRHFRENHEWMLNPSIFRDIVKFFDFDVNIDLFATRLNHQTERFVAWEPDPDAWAIDAFSLNWAEFNFYAFPPFSLLARCLQKVILDKAKGIIVAPDWPTQPWYPVLKSLCVRPPYKLQQGKATQILVLPSHPRKRHPLQKMDLLVCLVARDIQNP